MRDARNGHTGRREGRVIYMAGRHSGIYHIRAENRTGLRIEMIALRAEIERATTPHRELYAVALHEMERL